MATYPASFQDQGGTDRLDGNIVFTDATNGVTPNVSGAVKITAHAAPADGVLAAGDCFLWFDQTNSAGKLMIKAKTANGTVVAGEVDLA